MGLIRGKTQTKRKLPFIKALIVTMVAAIALAMGGVSVAYAAAGDTPDHAKTLYVNDDGTYTIALDVTGDSEKQVQKVNVVVILDRSGSMDESSGTSSVTYTPTTNNWYEPQYGVNDAGEYVELERVQRGFFPFVSITWYLDGEEYTGQRYLRQEGGQTRLEAAQEAVNGLANVLLSNNGKDGNPNDTVEMALVSFATSARTDVTPTTSTSTFFAGVNSLNANGGTNWEAALQQAGTVDFDDEDPTYVIFVSDGVPTFHSTDGGWRDYNRDYGVYGTGYEQQPNVSRSYESATDDAKTLADAIGADHFYTIFAYGDGSAYMEDLTEAAGAPADHFADASDTSALQAAFAAILEDISLAGIGNVSMADGTTSNVSTSSGDVSLLTIDEDSYKYYRAGGVADEGEGEKYDSTQNNGLGEEWADAPAARLEGSTVKWDIDGVLENDVKYTVTFDCWPSQTTLDYIADIKNDPAAYDKLPAEVREYFNRDGQLKTNTTATIAYTDTRTGESGSDEFENPDPVTSTAVEQLAVSKNWENELDGRSASPLDLTVTRDGADTYEINLSNDNDWTDSVYISIGIMRVNDDGETVLSPGHDFTFTEPEDLTYHWELDVPVIRPMLINGELTMLTKVDAKHQPAAGDPTYQIGDGTYFPGETGTASLTATNYRRSSVVLTKAVEGEAAPADAVFPFTAVVTNSHAASGTADNIDSDYWVWFSVQDKNSNPVNEGVSGATAEDGQNGWYYVQSGSSVTIDMKAGYTVRFNSLPTDSTYAFTEGTLPTGFLFNKSELSGAEDESFKGDVASSGTVQETNKLYTVTYTNEYTLTDITATKIWDDADDQDGIRPDELELTLNGVPDGFDVPTPEIAKNGNEWTYTWKGVPEFDSDGEAIEYTVTEATVPEGYEADNQTTDADKDYKITNTHEPEPINITVTKAWDDADDQDGIRPDNVSVQLYANGTASGEPVTLTADAQWTYTWNDLPKKAEGVAIEYTVDETAVPEGYEKDGITGTAADGFTITNSHTPEVITVQVQKVWEDVEDQDGIRPTTLEVTLSNGTKVTLSADKQWKSDEITVPKYADGTEITYTWTEADIEGYELTGNVTEGTLTTLTNKHTPETTEATVKKVWDDAEDQDGKRPASLEVTLSNGEKVTLTADNEWTATVSDLPKYADGEEISYTWAEDAGALPKGYALSGQAKEGTVTTLTNSYTPEKIDIEVQKVWEDADDQDGIRPESITVKLLAGGEDTGKTVELAGDEWKGAFEGLDKYAGGEEIAYTVEEVVPEGYEAGYDGYIITNTHTPETVDITVTKGWYDDDDQDGIRPDSVTVKLLAGGEDTGKTVVLNEGNDWTNTFSGLAKNKAGQPIAYTVAEDPVPEGYEAEVSGEAPKFAISNTHESEVIDVKVTKTWDDADDKDGIRPDSVTVQLLADGEIVDRTQLTADTQWTHTFSGLAKNKAGQPIGYTVKEAVPEGYTDETTGTAADGFIITNRHIAKADPVISDPPVQKIVTGNPPQDDTFTFQMKASSPDAPMPEGSSNGVKTVTITGSGSYEFGEMVYTEAGEWSYELSEVDTGLKGYTYDTTSYTLTVKVTEEVDGSQAKLVKTETITNSKGESADRAVFTNKYVEEPSEDPVVPKTGDDLGKVVTPLGFVAVASGLVALILGRKLRREH